MRVTVRAIREKKFRDPEGRAQMKHEWRRKKLGHRGRMLDQRESSEHGSEGKSWATGIQEEEGGDGDEDLRRRE